MSSRYIHTFHSRSFKAVSLFLSFLFFYVPPLSMILLVFSVCYSFRSVYNLQRSNKSHVLYQIDFNNSRGIELNAIPYMPRWGYSYTYSLLITWKVQVNVLFALLPRCYCCCVFFYWLLDCYFLSLSQFILMFVLGFSFWFSAYCIYMHCRHSFVWHTFLFSLSLSLILYILSLSQWYSNSPKVSNATLWFANNPKNKGSKQKIKTHRR